MAAAGALVAVLSTVLHGRPMVRPSVPLDVVPVTATSDQKTVGFREPFRTGQKVTTVRELHVFGGGDHGRVKVTGDAARVRLISIDGQIQAHDALRPGWYMVEADFGAGVFLAAGSVEVEPGKEHRLLCSSQRRACGSS